MPTFIVSLFHEAGAHDRLTHDDAFGPGDAGQRAELRVAALDELPKCWHIEPRRRSFALDTSKLAHVAIKRAPFPVVVIRHVDHERWSRGVVDEVVADP